MPENEQLKWATHNNVRRTLFFSVFRSIKYVEFKRLKNEEEDFFELVTPIEKDKEGFIDKFIENYITKEKVGGKLIDVQKWRVNRNNKSEGCFKVKYYHLNTDEFKGKVYPYSWRDTLVYLWFERKHFRIL